MDTPTKYPWRFKALNIKCSVSDCYGIVTMELCNIDSGASAGSFCMAHGMEWLGILNRQAVDECGNGSQELRH